MPPHLAKKATTTLDAGRHTRTGNVHTVEDAQAELTGEVKGPKWGGCARAILKRTELTSALLSIIYLIIIVGDLVYGELGEECVEETPAEAQWRKIYTNLDLAFLIFFGVEICLRLCAEGLSYFRSSALNAVDATTVVASLGFSFVAMFGNGPDLALLRLFRLTRIVKMVGAYNRLVKMRERLLRIGWAKSLLLLRDQMAITTMVFRASGRNVELLPPLEIRTGGTIGYHLFLSHVWAHAQDTAGAIKTALSFLVPSCRVFLDVDELDDISSLETAVGQTDVVVIIITDKYLSSANCRRELTAAIGRQKPLVLLVECDTDKGATSVGLMRAELERANQHGTFSRAELDACNQLIIMLESTIEGGGDDDQVPRVIEWHREKDFKNIAYKALVANLLKTQVREVPVEGEGTPRQPGRTPCIRQCMAVTWPLPYVPLLTHGLWLASRWHRRHDRGTE